MNKIYTSDNYIIVEFDGKTKAFSQTKSEYEEHLDHFVLIRTSDNKIHTFPFNLTNTWFDESGTIAFNKETLRTFFRKNTGFKTASGSSGAEILNLQIYKYAVDLYSDLSILDPIPNEGDIARVYNESSNIFGFNKKLSGAYTFLNGVWIYGSQSLQNEILQNNSDIQDLKDNKSDIGHIHDYPNLISNNSGQIKLNWNEANRPSITGVVDAVSKKIDLNNNYTLSSFPTTIFPYLANEAIGGDNCINPNTLLLREIKSGQIITFRIELGYSGKVANQLGAIILNISNPNPNSAFSQNLSISALRGRTEFTQPVEISVIADNLSLNELYGYELSIITEFTDGNMKVFINNMVVIYNASEIFNK